MSLNNLSRIILLLAITIFSRYSVCLAQEKKADSEAIFITDESSDDYYFERVVEVAGISKTDMFARAKEWTLSKLKTVDNNIHFDEQQFSIMNGSTLLLRKTGVFVNFKVSILFKDGKYKFRFDNLVVTYTSGTLVLTKPYGPKMFPNRSFSRKIMNESDETFAALAKDR